MGYKEIGNENLGGKGFSLSMEYYYKAFELIELSVNSKVYIITDEPELIRKILKLKVPLSVRDNHFIIGLLLFINTDNLILNSYFS